MKKIIATLLIMTLIFTLGCAAKTTQTVKTDTAKETTADTSQAAPATAETGSEAAGATAAAVSEVESELDAIDDLDEDFLSTELDDLDSELDFEI